MANPIINIELIYALPNEQKLFSIQVATGTTVQQAIESSGILIQYPEIDLKQNKVGIFSQVTALDTLLRDKDRIEIYRALTADPKEARKKKASLQKKRAEQ